MKEDNSKTKITWSFLALGTVTIITGCIMIILGIEGYKTGTIIPQTRKSGPMTGGQAIITGVLAVCLGLAFLGHEVMKIIRRRRLFKKEN